MINWKNCITFEMIDFWKNKNTYLEMWFFVIEHCAVRKINQIFYANTWFVKHVHYYIFFSFTLYVYVWKYVRDFIFKISEFFFLNNWNFHFVRNIFIFTNIAINYSTKLFAFRIVEHYSIFFSVFADVSKMKKIVWIENN